MKNVSYDFSDISCTVKDKTIDVQNITYLEIAITCVANEWDDPGGHITHEQLFNIEENNSFENLQFEKEKHSLVIEADNIIKKQVTRRNGSLMFENFFCCTVSILHAK